MIRPLSETPISAVIPVRNGEQYIRNSFEEVTGNLAKNDEAIFVINGSTDKSLEIAKNLAKNDTRVRVLNLGEVGLVEALNIGVLEAHNPWIARFDVDDFYSVDRLSRQRNQISAERVAIFSDYSIVGDDLSELGVIPSGISNLPTTVSLYGANRTAHPSAMFSKQAFLAAGKYKREDFGAEDLGLWLRLARQGEFASVPLPLVKYRLHGKSTLAMNRQLALLNTKLLLSEIGLPRHVLAESILKIDIICSDYKKATYSNERIILFVLNLYQASKYMKFSTKERSILHKAAISRLGSAKAVPALIKLGIESRKRMIYRKSHGKGLE